jgi:murein DD-endopeptidase MepM/ murein hydrolase activator NlpD
MPNTKNMSAFAVRRNYVYRGKIVDTQVHLGLDLASTAGAPVPAANDGIVVFAENLGIYGQTVIVDHGQGLFSLYSHQSGIAVAPGDHVSRGAPVGSSGQTGMAGGDHLHFSVLVSGEFVSPLEWLDGHWISDNIENKLSLFVPVAVQ